MVTALLIYRNDCFSYRPFNYVSTSAILLNTNAAICCTKVSCLVSCFMSSALMLELLGTGIAEKAHSYASKGPGLCLWERWISKHTLRGNLGSSTSPAFWSVWIIGIFPKMWSCPKANPQAMSWAREFTKMVVVQKDQGKGTFCISSLDTMKLSQLFGLCCDCNVLNNFI